MTTTTTMLREMTIRYAQPAADDGQPAFLRRVVLTAGDIAPALVTLLGTEVAEVFAVVFLSTKCEVIGYYQVSRGTLDATPVHPREVFKAALLANAATMIVSHNHPSGDPAPSRDDVLLTRRLIDGGRLLGVPIVDHVIVGHTRWVSLRALGLM